MAEIKRKPYDIDGVIIFDTRHTTSDIIRYLLSEGMTPDEIYQTARDSNENTGNGRD